MSRVIANTLRSAAVGGLVLTSLVFAACGGDDDSSTAAATAPATATVGAAETSPKEIKSAELPEPDTDGAPAVFKGDTAVTKEGTKAIKSASSKLIPSDELTSQVTRIQTAMESAGFKVSLEAGSDQAPSVIRTNDRINVSIFPSERAAAQQAASVLLLLEQSKLSSRVARDDNVVITIVGKERGAKFTKKQLSQFSEARNAVKPV
ncbi:MAG: hypothetical protein PGN13_14060 [Patulibacter minatonensis]